MATPAAVLSILVDAQTGKAATALSGMQRQLQVTEGHVGAVDEKTGRFNRTLGAVNQNAGKASSGLSGLAKRALLAGGAFVAFEAAKSAVKDVAALGEATVKLSAITGLDAKQTSTWIEVMKVRGVATKQVSMAFITLSKNIKSAEDAGNKQSDAVKALTVTQKQQLATMEATGSSHKAIIDLEAKQATALETLKSKTTPATAAFKELGVSQRDIAKGDTQAVLLDVAQGLSKIENPARRAALAQQLFGRGAQALIPVLAQGRKGVDDLLASAQRYGAFLPNNVRLLRGAVDAQHNMNLAMDGLKISFTEAVLPMLVAGAQKLMTFIQQMRDGSGAGGQFAAVIKTTFGVVKTVVGGAVGVLGGFGNTVRVVIAAFAAYKVLAFTNALRVLFAVTRLSPLGALLTAATVLVGVFAALSSRQGRVAFTAQEVSNAWRRAAEAAQALKYANITAAQAVLDHVRAQQQLKDAVNAAADAKHRDGIRSPQYAQAQLDVRQATIDLQRSQVEQTQATNDAITAARAAITADRQKAFAILATTQQMKKQGDTADEIRPKQAQLDAVLKQLGVDQKNLNTALGNMPPSKVADVSVKMDFVSNIAGAIGSIAKNLSKGFAQGGMVNAPGYFAGEEAPAHPEIILASNPAYRNRNLDLWAQAGHMLGVPGFATGGSTNSAMVGATEPWAAKAGSAWMKPKAQSWSDKLVQKIQGAFGGPSGDAGGGAGSPAAARAWTAQAMALAGVSGSLWTNMLLRQEGRESSYNPLSINLTDINAQQGHPSKGILQTIDGTFSRYMVAGHGNIWNPVDNIAAAIRYMIATYGGGNPNTAAQVMWARGGGGYKRGGIFGHFKRGGKHHHKAMGGKPVLPSIASLASIPSQGVLGQIQMARVANQLQVAQNVGSVPDQKTALVKEQTLERAWLAADKKQLSQINTALRKKGLSRKNRGKLLADKLALLQEIGTIQSAIGSDAQSLTSLAAGTTGTGASGGDPNQGLIDAENAAAAASQAQTDAMNALTAVVTKQLTYMQSVGAVETSQAIKALSDVISGQIGGNYVSRASGSAGVGTVARY